MAVIPTLDDWLELLGLGSVMTSLFAGEISADAAEDAIRAEWESYPNVSQDYVAILEQAVFAVDAVRRSIEAQQDAITEFNAVATEFGLSFDIEPGRLMTTDEEVEFERLGEELRHRIEMQETELSRLVRESEQQADESDQPTEEQEARKQADDAEDKVAAAEDEYEEALAAVEAAIAAYVKLLNESLVNFGGG